MARYPKKNKVRNLERIPDELMVEILSRVASSSLVDISNVKLSSKRLYQLGEDKQIYRNACLHKFQNVYWSGLNEKQHTFLSKCRQNSNPQLLYQEALLDFFNKAENGLACQKLDKASRSGHVGALYAQCIVLIFSGDDELKRRGIKLIGEVKRSGPLNVKRKLRLKYWREELKKELGKMWVMNAEAMRVGPKCCTASTHNRRIGWTDEDEDDDDDECDACSADREVRFLSL